MGGACSTHGTYEEMIGNFSRKTEGKRPLGRIRHREEDNIKVDIMEMVCEDVDWIHLMYEGVFKIFRTCRLEHKV
jgi:hypothetical protein